MNHHGPRQAMRTSIVLAALLAACIAPGWAQVPYPAKPVRIVVPFPPGGPTDLLARVLAQKLGESMGQQFLVDNRPGATGTIATAMVAKSPPDGYTLIMQSTSSHVSAYLYRKITYDPMKDIVQRMLTLGGVAAANSPEQFADFLKSDTPKWIKVINDTGARVN